MVWGFAYSLALVLGLGPLKFSRLFSGALLVLGANVSRTGYHPLDPVVGMADFQFYQPWPAVCAALRTHSRRLGSRSGRGEEVCHS